MAKNVKKPVKTLGPQAAGFVTTLYERNQTIFGVRDVRAITGLTDPSARSFVRTLVDRGLVTRLKPGLYILVPFEMGRDREYMGDPLLVAKALVRGKDYYVSYATAMEVHQMVTQPRLVVYVSTPERLQHRSIMGTEFRFVFCKKKSLFGIVEHWVTKQEKVQVSDLERTVVDGLKNPDYCGGLTEVAKGLWMQRHKMSPDRLIRYAIRLKVGTVIRRLGFLLELYEMATEEITRVLRDQLTNTYAPLDPALPANGKHLHRWRLHVNVQPDELLSVVRT